VDENKGESCVSNGALLTKFVEAILQGTYAEQLAARQSVRATLGDAAFVDTCATVASFNSVVKIADGTGIPLEDAKETKTMEMRDSLRLNEFRR